MIFIGYLSLINSCAPLFKSESANIFSIVDSYVVKFFNLSKPCLSQIIILHCQIYKVIYALI